MVTVQEMSTRIDNETKLNRAEPLVWAELGKDINFQVKTFHAVYQKKRLFRIIYCSKK